VSMMSPWSDPYYLKRVWCVFEMYTACSHDKNIIIVMPPCAERAFQEELLKEEGTNGLWQALKNISIGKAEATVIQDKEKIFDLIQSEAGPGFPKLNQIVARCLKSWAIGISERYVLERFAAQDLPDVELGKLCLRVVGFMKTCGRQRHTAHLREIGIRAFERAGALESPDGWNMMQLDCNIKASAYDFKGANFFLEKAELFVTQWSQDSSKNDAMLNFVDVCKDFKNGEVSALDEGSKFMIKCVYYITLIMIEACHYGHDSAHNHRAKYYELVDSMGAPQNSVTALVHLWVHLIKLWDPHARDVDAAFDATKMALQAIDGLNDAGQMWSPDHASFLGISARIKNICGHVDAARADAEQAYEIYEKLGGMEFRYDSTLGCDTCGELMMLLGILKYKEGDKKGAKEAFDTGVRICEELGTLDFNLCRMGWDGAMEKSIVMKLRGMVSL